MAVPEVIEPHGFLHRPASDSGTGVVLAHGAGSNANAPLLVTLAEALAEAGYLALRMNLPFRRARANGPPFPAAAAADRAGILAAGQQLRELGCGRIVLAGHSYGGRQSAMLAAENREAGDALVLLSYPLHPPRKPQQLRTAHFPELRTPAVFVHGTRDPFGSIGEMKDALRLIPSGARLVEVAGAGHDLKNREIAIIVLRELADLLT
ncbi:MAG: alpha/beta fold hydrolase [Bryobacteraceae bacterium]|nr:alpha/beta fold hydrolase [Bryobacteraceae bacterium]